MDAPRTVRVRPLGDGWEVIVEGDRGGLLFQDRDEALESAREWAAAHPPVVIIVYGPGGAEEERLEFP